MSREGRIVSKIGGANFRNLHPYKGAKRKLDAEGEDSKYTRCKQCGFIVNRDINQRGSGYGNEQYEQITGLATDIIKYDIDGTVGGCPFCYSSEYE